MRRKLKELNIETIYDAQVRELIENAKKQAEYKDLVVRRNSVDSALNDIVARLYVEKHRGSNDSDFSDIKCWFLHNSYSPYEYSSNRKICNRWSIGANELLVLLWLATPAQGCNVNIENIVKGGIASYITKYRRSKTPSTSVLKVIKQKIDNAVSLGVVDEKTIYNLTLRMSEGSVDQQMTNDLETLQDADFISKINEFKEVDKAKDNRINALKNDIESLRREDIIKNNTLKK